MVLNIAFDRTEQYSPAVAQNWEAIKKRHKITFRDIPDGEFFPGVTPNPGHGFRGEVTLTRCPGGGMEFRSAASGGFTTREAHLTPGKYAVSIVYGGARGGRFQGRLLRRRCYRVHERYHYAQTHDHSYKRRDLERPHPVHGAGRR